MNFLLKKIAKVHIQSTIRLKLILVTGLLLIIPVLALGGISYSVAKGELESGGKTLLKNSVEMTLQVIDTNQKLVDQGKLSLDEAKENVRVYMLGIKQADGTRQLNKNLTLGESGYLLAYTQEGVEAAHPSLEGKSVIDVADKKTGILFVKKQIELANKGGGYLSYWWTLPNSEKIAEKITFQKADPHWGWVVSAGTYIDDFNQGSQKILGTTMLVLLVVLVLGSAIIILFAQHISGPIKKIAKAVDVVASGNLNLQDLKIKNRDEIGQLNNSFQIMTKNVSTLIGSIKDSADVVLSSSQELENIVYENTISINEVAVSVEDIAKSSNDQAVETENGVIRMKVLANQIDHVAELVVNTDETAAVTTLLGAKGLEAMDLLSQKSDDNSRAAKKVSDIILEVDRSAVEIGAIADAIGEISAQTNLLSLNAAIEAARAGEQGRGFAVVAAEVRKLATQAAVSAVQVRERINGVQDKSKAAVAAMAVGQQIAEEQFLAVTDAKKLIVDILQSLETITNDLQTMKVYSVNMESEKDEIVAIFETFSASTEENSAATQQVSAATEEQLASINQIVSNTHELKNLAEKFREAVNAFQI
mgnify:CR=1 FL=1